MSMKYMLHLLPNLAVVLIFFFKLASATPLLAPDEVAGLKVIGERLGKVDWDFSVDPCSGEKNWMNQYPVLGYENGVKCDCSFLNNTLCHVISIVLKTQNLQGTLPKEFANLPFLQEIDLTRNYLNGSFPPEWGSLPLVNISFLANRISGPLPKEIGNITTLANLTIEFNQISGPIPQELGNCLSLEKIFLTSNNFTGELPVTLAKLSLLKDFRIGDNNFVGSIPNFIQNWTNLQKLVIQGSGLSGPIPPEISKLTNLSDLRISDLNGNDSVFPDLSGATIRLQRIILRKCNIVGVLPDYLGSMINLKVLDVSFNKLTGQIPKSLSGLLKANYIYLTGNFFNGQVPDWMLNNGNQIDLSYNNLTNGNSNPPACFGRNLNMFSTSSWDNASGIASCLKSFRCPKNDLYTLNINCGGDAVKTDDNTLYEADLDAGGPSNFVQSPTNWISSSTGHFLDNDLPRDLYIVTNISQISTNNSRLYTNARISPLSLTYYGFCLRNGNYTVNLHFAEIKFSNGPTYLSLGKRVFNIYIQGKLVQKDFNIEDEAGGANIGVIRAFIAQVIDNTLEIRFYWAGKGTISIPNKGVYGPLVSAISVNPR